jgi:FKBP-type peptidyl-prolyl cis-trans isomerase FkpA
MNAMQVTLRSRLRRYATQKPGRWSALAFVAASLSLSCGAATLPRETTANDARIDDPWLEGGERCGAGSQDDTGVVLEEVEAGTGKAVGDGQEVRVHYVAKLPNGSIIHDTRQGGAPIEIVIGSTKIICGFEKALLGMRAGAQRRATVPWRLAFGEGGRPPEVPPRTNLTFVIDLFLPAVTDLENGAPPRNPARGGGGGGRGR